MTRVALLAVLVLLPLGCRLPPDGQALRALPEDRPIAYDELMQRARAQATAAVEAFYVDGWRDLEDAAAALEQSARLLPRATNLPAALDGDLAAMATALHKDAVQLGDAARGRDVNRANELLQRLNLAVRRLRPREGPTPERLSPAGRLPDRPPAVEATPGPAK